VDNNVSPLRGYVYRRNAALGKNGEGDVLIKTCDSTSCCCCCRRALRNIPISAASPQWHPRCTMAPTRQCLLMSAAATAMCGVVLGLLGLELQTNAITLRGHVDANASTIGRSPRGRKCTRARIPDFGKATQQVGKKETRSFHFQNDASQRAPSELTNRMPKSNPVTMRKRG